MYRRTKKYQQQVAYLTAAWAVCPSDTLPPVDLGFQRSFRPLRV